MSITFGFYNSLNGDRKYTADQLSSIFDGLIIDGVFASIGTAFVVKASSGFTVNVGVGKAWFNHTWTYNDSVLPITLDDPELSTNRYDAIVLDINGNNDTRVNDIIVVKGTPAMEPKYPTLINEGKHRQYPLCYIFRAGSSLEITQAEITNMVGTESTPFVAGILKTVSLDELLGQWEAELDQFVERTSGDVEDWLNTLKEELQNEKYMLQKWIESEEEDFLEWFAAKQGWVENWISEEQTVFNDWFSRIRGQLDEDPAGNLQNQLDNETIKRILTSGLVDGTKVISEDGKVITSTSPGGYQLVKTFSDDFSTLTIVLQTITGIEIAKCTKTYSANGSVIDVDIDNVHDSFANGDEIAY